MPKKSSKARRALTEERRKQILDAATQVFAEKGFDRATIADIAQAAGVAEGSIYNYFKNKDDLLVSIPRQAVQPTVEAMSTRMVAVSGDASSPDQVLATVAREIIAAVQQNAHIFRVMLSALPTMSQSARAKYVNQVVLYVMTMLESYFKEQIKLGVFPRESNPTTLARGFVGMFLPFMALREVLHVETGADWKYESVIPELVSVFLRGVMVKPPQGKSK